MASQPLMQRSRSFVCNFSCLKYYFSGIPCTGTASDILSSRGQGDAFDVDRLYGLARDRFGRELPEEQLLLRLAKDPLRAVP